MKRRISIDQLKPGMHLVGLDQSWLKSPLWIHRGPVKSQAEIRRLKQAGVREVTIDSDQGLDLDDSSSRSVLPHHGEEGKQAGLTEGPTLRGSRDKETSFAKSHSIPAFDLVAFEEEVRLAHEMRSQAVSAVKRVFEGIKTGIALEAGPLQDVTNMLFECLKAREGSVLADVQLQRMMKFDVSLFSHAVDVCVLVLVVGYKFKLPDRQLQDLAIGALLHDVGQLRLPKNLLSKRGVFTQEERSLYLTHPTLGESILSKAEGISDATRRIVLEHHERVNGSGYPWKRQGKTITPLAQLVGLVDRYDALVSKRGGRPPLPPALAVRRMYQLGMDGEFAMEWVEKMVQCLGLYPIGSLVELTTGERGWVVSINQADHMLPMVKVVWSHAREKLLSPCIVDLSSYAANGEPVRVVRVLNPLEEGIQDDLCFVPVVQHAFS